MGKITITGTMLSSDQQVIVLYSVLVWFSLSSFYLVAAFELSKLAIFWKINLDQTLQIHNNNLDCKGLNTGNT